VLLTSGPSLIAPADVFGCPLRSRYALLTDSNGCQERVGTSVAVSARASSWRGVDRFRAEIESHDFSDSWAKT
jgi:hypothetical protein